jgi:hypothetical protein
VTFVKNNPVPFFVPQAQYVGRNNRITVLFVPQVRKMYFLLHIDKTSLRSLNLGLPQKHADDADRTDLRRFFTNPNQTKRRLPG